MKIKIEKMNLERNIGKYQGVLRKSGFSLLIGIFGIMVQLILPEFLKMIGINKPAINVIVMIIVIVYVMNDMGKSFDKQRPRDLMMYVALKVLDDIEKEINEKKKQLKNNLSFNEVAATNDDSAEKDIVNKRDCKGIN